MSVSVSAVQLRILVVAISVVTVGQLMVASIGDGRAASMAKLLPGPFTAGRKQSVQPPTRLYAGGAPQASSCTPFQSAGARPTVGEACAAPVAPSVLTLEDQEMLRPRSVNTLIASLLFGQN
jgi:hypothetical protein